MIRFEYYTQRLSLGFFTVNVRIRTPGRDCIIISAGGPPTELRQRGGGKKYACDVLAPVRHPVIASIRIPKRRLPVQ